MKPTQDVFFPILTKGCSSKEVCDSIGRVPSNQQQSWCINYEGGGVWVRTTAAPHGVKHKLQKKLDIKLGDPQ